VSLRLRARERAILTAHLCAAYPEEGCGVLIGRDAGGVREVERAGVLPNQREDARGNRYLIAPEALLAADREARAAGLDVIGFFHSHPDHPARPSAFDLEHAWPYYSYVIASVERGELAELRSFRLSEDRSRFEPEPIVPAGEAVMPAAGPEEPRT
jgi:proteasome lid subunit RPN8/RPN11